MKKFLVMLLAVVMLMAMFVGCAKDTDEPAGDAEQAGDSATEDAEPAGDAEQAGDETADNEEPAEDAKIVLIIPGNLGDQSFMDMAHLCVPMIKEQYGIDVKVVEMGMDSSTWYSAYVDYCELDYDIIISLTGADEQINEAADNYPDQTFLNIASGTTFDQARPNVQNVVHLCNEMSALGGVAAALKAQELGEDTIGFVGGMDIPGINEFLVGYIQGAKWINPDIKVVPSYVGDFADPSKGKENALLLYQQGISVIYSAAGGSGLGVLEAAAETGKFTIGVDLDQYEQLKETSPEMAETIITSCVKNIPQMATELVGQCLDGTIKLGEFMYVGLNDGGVGVSINENTEKLLGSDNLAILNDYLAKFKAGELELSATRNVSTGEMMSPEDMAAIIDAARP